MDFTRRRFFIKNSLLLGSSLVFPSLALQSCSSETPVPIFVEPIGVAKGIHPGRVVWVWDDSATNWDGYDSLEHWWQDDCTDLNQVREMISKAIQEVAGEATDSSAWNAIFSPTT